MAPVRIAVVGERAPDDRLFLPPVGARRLDSRDTAGDANTTSFLGLVPKIVSVPAHAVPSTCLGAPPWGEALGLPGTLLRLTSACYPMRAELHLPARKITV